MKHEAMLYKKLQEKALRCFLCPNNCLIKPGGYGRCNVRQNIDGTLYTHTYSRLIAAHVDPIEKKPLYHFLPGSNAFSIAAPGCNLKCDFCQNWQISQIDKPGAPTGSIVPVKQVVQETLASDCKTIAYTYTEPTVFLEYAVDVMRAARQEGIKNVFITNGFMSRQAADTISEYLDAANIDLKSFSDNFYLKRCKGSLKPVLETIRHLKELGVWIEVTTLVVPGANDSESELKGIAGFIAETGIDIPWHINRFHPDYKSLDLRPTPIETMRAAASIGHAAGLRYVYLGNVPGMSQTLCYKCGNPLITREYPKTETIGLDKNRCANCQTVIDGVF